MGVFVWRIVDATTMRASIPMLGEELETNNIDFFLSKRATWDHWKKEESPWSIHSISVD